MTDADHGIPADVAAALDANEEVTLEVSGGTQNRLEGLVDRLIESKERVEALDASLTAERATYDDIRKKQLPVLMQELGMIRPDGRGGFTHSSGARVHLRVEIWAHIKKDVQPETFAQLRAAGHGDIIKETINAQTLRALVKDWLDDGTPIPPGVTHTMETVAVLVKPKGGSE
jgi:hypothetical protein